MVLLIGKEGNNMAIKDHTLDEKIIKSAFEEFMKYGFQKASLHKISERAGITTGALYTRYKNKDALFCSLIQNMFTAVQEKSTSVANRYYEVQRTGDISKMIDAIKEEEKIYLDILFEYYDECILFFCKNAGSSIEIMINKMMDQKGEQTVEFIKTLPGINEKNIDLDGIGMIMTEQFQIYRMILEKGYSKEKAVSCMKTFEVYVDAGWKALFEKLYEK